ncbi:hypothetical protein K8I85_08540, partial [bacterium]|nr:hypothetical protein [bacterium]
GHLAPGKGLVMAVRSLLHPLALFGALAPATALAASLCIDSGACVVPDGDFYTEYPIYWSGFAEDLLEHCHYEEASAGYGGCGTPTGIRWTISVSDADPGVNVAPLPDDGWLHLWCDYSVPGPTVAAGFHFDGSLVPVEFEAADGVTVASELPMLTMTIDSAICPPFVAGRIRVQEPSPVEATTWSRVKELYR